MPTNDTSEVDALLLRLRTVLSPDGYTAMLRYVGGRVGTLAEGFVRDEGYPPSPNGRPLETYYTLNGRPSKFKTTKQRGYFFWALRNNKLRLPYKRTGFLGNSITHEVIVVGSGAVVRVGTNLQYARWVIGGKGQQSHYHTTTGWLSLPEQITRHTPELRGEIVSSLHGYMRGLGK